MREKIYKILSGFLFYSLLCSQIVLSGSVKAASPTIGLTVTPTSVIQGVPAKITYSVTYNGDATVANSTVSTPIPPQTSFNAADSASKINGGECFFDGGQNKIYWTLTQASPTLDVQFVVDYPSLNPGNCPNLPVEPTVLTATIEKTGIRNESGLETSYGLKDLGGGSEVVLAENNQALMQINVSPSVDYRANFYYAPGSWTWDEDYVSASKSIDYLKTLLDKMSGVVDPNQFKISWKNSNGTATSLTSGIVIALYNDLPNADKNDATLRSKLGIGSANTEDFLEAYYIKTTNDRILIAANGMYGLSHGIQMFLRAYGYRMYFMEGDREFGNDARMAGAQKNWEIIPEAERLMANLHLSDRPAISGRFIFIAGSDWWKPTPTAMYDYTAWYRAIFANAVTKAYGHKYQELWGNKTYLGGEFTNQKGYAIFNAHPEFVLGFNQTRYPDRFDHHLYEGVDTYGTICLQAEAEDRKCPALYMLNFANPSLRNLWLQYEKDKINTALADRGSGVADLSISLTASDGLGWYFEGITNPADQNWYPNWYDSLSIAEKANYSKDGWAYDHPSDQYYGMANFMYQELTSAYAQEISSGILKLDIGILSYALESQPPHFKLHENIEVMIQSSYCGYPDCGPGNVAIWSDYASSQGQPDRKFILSQFVDIKEFSRDFYPSIVPSTSAGFKEFFVDRMANLGLSGVRFTSQSHNGISGLGLDLLAFGTWNPQLDYENYTQDFFDKAFGSVGSATECTSVRGCIRQYFAAISTENLQVADVNSYAKAVKLLDDAYNLAKANYTNSNKQSDLQIVYRINDLKLNWYHTYLVDQLRYNSNLLNRSDLINQFFGQLFFKQGKSYMVSWEAMGYIMNPAAPSAYHYIDTSEVGYWDVETTPQKWTGTCSAP